MGSHARGDVGGRTRKALDALEQRLRHRSALGPTETVVRMELNTRGQALLAEMQATLLAEQEVLVHQLKKALSRGR